MGLANSSSHTSLGNGTEKAGLGGIFGLPLGLAREVEGGLLSLGMGGAAFYKCF